MADPAGRGPASGAVFTVMMLAPLRLAFTEWLASRGLVMERVPGAKDGVFAVMPDPSRDQATAGYGRLLDRNWPNPE